MSRENEKGHEHSIASFGAVMQLTCKNNFKLGKHYGKVNVDTRFTAYNLMNLYTSPSDPDDCLELLTTDI